MRCVLCNGDNFEKLFSDNEEFDYLKCRSCGLVKTVGSKKRVSYKHYHRDSDYKKYDKYFENIFRKRFNTISGFTKSSGKVLDVGAASGVMLQIFFDNGWEVFGVEPSGSARELEKKGFKVYKTILEKAKLPQDYFDVVVMNHTLEHVDDPVLAMKIIYKALKRKGIVYIDVPNFGSLDASIWGRNWQYLLPYEHIHQFTPETLRKVFEKAKFEVIWWDSWSGVFDSANIFDKYLQNIKIMRPHSLKRVILDTINIPFNIVTTFLNKGVSLGMVGKK